MNRSTVFSKRDGMNTREASHIPVFIKALACTIVLLGMGYAGTRCYNWALSSPFFSVISVNISPMVLMKESDILEISGFKAGENLISLNTEEMGDRLNAYPWISDSTIEKKYPDSLLINVSERFPFAIVLSDKIYLVDREGVALSILEKLPDLSIPVITDRKKQSLVPGERLDSPDFLVGRTVILSASGKLLNYESEVASVELLEDGKIRVLYRNSSVPVLVDRFNIEEGFLKLNYMKGVLEETGVKEIDLSFRNQAVVKREEVKNLKSGNLALAGEL